MAHLSQDLAHLHDLQIQLRDVREELARGPRLIKVKAKKVDAANQEVSDREEELKNARAHADKKNLDLKTREARITDLKVKLNSATNNKEYAAITGQIEADETANAVLEDEILEALEKVDQAVQALEDEKANAARTEKDRKDFEAQFADDEKTLRAREAELEGLSAEAEGVLKGDDLDKFRRTKEADGADALSVVEDRVCQLCQRQVRPQQMVQLKQGNVEFCSNCSCLLYLPPKSVATVRS